MFELIGHVNLSCIRSNMNVLAVLFLVMCPFFSRGQFNMTDYRKMPPLYSFDDWDSCLQTPEKSSYCLAIAEIVPNATSSLWNQIANFSADHKRHFRHDNLLFGVCVNQCNELMRELSPLQQEQLYTGQIKNTELVEFFTDIEKTEANNRIIHDKVINTCLNFKFRPQYGLQLRSFIEYCETNRDSKPLDFLEIIFIVTVCTLLILAIFSSSYDRQLRKKDCPRLHVNEFYKQKLHTPRDTLLTAFSIYRNYYRFVEPSRSELAHDLRFFEGFRFISTLLVVLAHVLLVLKSIPILNTEFTEKLFHTVGSNLLVNGTVIIQVFFVMSSFLLCVGFQKNVASRNPGFPEWVKLVVYRYLRLTPSMGLVILLNASVLPRFQNGPYWRQVIGAEHKLCRETWWKNLLFINNFTLRKSCLHQTWYLAADFQLYVLLAAVLIFMTRFPKTKTYVLAAGIVLSFLSTGLLTYFLKLDAIHQETPDAYRYFFWTNSDTIYKAYTPFYTNLGGSVFGAITGMIYLKYKNEAKNMKKHKSKLNKIILLCTPIPFLILLSGEIFYHFEFTKPSIWIAIYAALFRNVWAIMSCVIVLLMSFKLGTLLYQFAAIKIFVPLGRLSFQVFLIHSFVLRCVTGSIRQPLYTNRMTLITYALATIVMSFVAAFFLYITFELPLTTIVNMTTNTKRRTNTVIAAQLTLGPKRETPDTPVAS